jgi:solute carrier family 35 protein F5
VLVTKSDAAIEPISEPVATPAGIPTLPSHPILGDIAALLSAFFYSVYLILLKVKVGDEERADMQLLLGWVQAGFLDRYTY